MEKKLPSYTRAVDVFNVNTDLKLSYAMRYAKPAVSVYYLNI